MLAFEIVVICVSSLVVGAGLIGIGVATQWHLRKAKPYPMAAPREATVAAPRQPEPALESFAPPKPQVEPAAPAVREPAAEAPPRAPIRLGLGLRKTRENFLSRLRTALTRSAKADDIYEGLEEALIAADVGVDASLRLTSAVRTKLGAVNDPDRIRGALKDEIGAILEAAEQPLGPPTAGPFVIMMVGVNGAGKTTTVAKLAARFKTERGSVIVAAADTFRAAAIEQLEVWCTRAGAQIIKHKQGSDPAAVAFDAVKAAVARKANVVLIDTAGRIQTKTNLMEELKKIARVIDREIPGAPHEAWLVLDATTGQNALSQAKLFGEAVKITGVVLAKLDSTAKGGIVISIAQQLKLPVRYVGLGEGIEDLRPFDSREFVDALFSDAEEGDSGSGRTAAA